MMRELMAVAFVFMFSYAAMAQGQDPAEEIARMDLGGAFVYFMPSDSDTYDYGSGPEGQLRYWFRDEVGLSLSIAVYEWEAEDQAVSGVVEGVAVDATASGSTLLYPIGASLLFRPKLTQNLMVALEAGFKYVMVWSDIDGRATAVAPNGDRAFVRQNLEIDDGFVALVSANLEGRITDRLVLFAGIGYQFDLAKGDVKFLDQNIGDNELEAAYLRIGVAGEF